MMEKWDEIASIRSGWGPNRSETERDGEKVVR